jgi:class 3 adenylate cyclase/CheY-like chemotaxis protein
MGHAHNPAEPTASADSNPALTRADGGSVLIVDDTPMNARLLSDILGFHGYTTHVAESGEAALGALASERIDLVVLDVVMPGMDGFETCRRIRADPANAMLPIVMATSLDSKEDRVRGLEAGADDFLSKPINKHELLARVRSLMRIKRLYETVTAQRTELAALAKSLEARVVEEVAKSERLSSLKRFFSPQLVELIVAGGADNPLHSHRREITVVFLDLRGFTAFAEAGEPEVVMQALSEFHQAMGQLVMQHQGTLERFTGDGMMVFFNDPVPVAEPTKRAAQMALEMRAQAESLRLRWAKRGFTLGLGIGIADGFATVGAIGFDHRIDYAAIGPVTNLAARLCGHAEAGEVLVSQRAFVAIEEAFNAAPLGEIAMRGFSKPVAAVRLLSAKTNAKT